MKKSERQEKYIDYSKVTKTGDRTCQSQKIIGYDQTVKPLERQWWPTTFNERESKNTEYFPKMKYIKSAIRVDTISDFTAS